jgi:hypothetical protein
MSGPYGIEGVMKNEAARVLGASVMSQRCSRDVTRARARASEGVTGAV